MSCIWFSQMTSSWGRNPLVLISLLTAFFSVKETKCKSLVNLNFSPSWQKEISQRVSDYVDHTVMPFVSKELNEVSVPGMSGAVKTPLGQVDYTLDNVKLSSVLIQKSKVSLQSNHGLRLTTEDTGGNLKAKWHYRERSWPHISDSGSCTVFIKGLGLGLTFHVDGDLESKKLKGNIKAKDCSLKIGSLKINFEGGASWLYNLFASELADDLKGHLEKEICSSATNLLDSKATKTLDSLPALIKKLEFVS